MRRGVLLGILLVAGSLSVAVMGSQGPPPAGQGGGQRAGGRQRAWGGRGAAPHKHRRPSRCGTTYMIANGGGKTAIFIMSNGVTSGHKDPNGRELSIRSAR